MRRLGGGHGRLVSSATARRVERLEDRSLLSTLVDITTNSGTFINTDPLQTTTQLSASPREFTIKVSPGTSLAAASLGGVTVERAGNDGTFALAFATTDFGTNGAAVLSFTAQDYGPTGNGVNLAFTTLDLGSGLPTVSVSGTTVNVTLNNNAINATTAQSLVGVLNANVAVKALLTASVSGNAATPVGTAPGATSTVALTGGEAARVVSDLGTGGPLQFQLVAKAVGPAGNGITFEAVKANLGAAAGPSIAVTGNTIVATLNTNAAKPTTAAMLRDAINTNAKSSALVVASTPVGNAAVSLASASLAYVPLVLSGANDLSVTPGFVGIDPNNSNEIIYRFANTLPDDVYRIDLAGRGASALMDTSNAPFNNGVNVSVPFSVDVGPQVNSIVPMPTVRIENINILNATKLSSGDNVAITAGGQPVTFVLDSTGTITSPTVVQFLTTDTAAMVASKVSAAINTFLTATGNVLYLKSVGVNPSNTSQVQVIAVGETPTMTAVSQQAGALSISDGGLDAQLFHLEVYFAGNALNRATAQNLGAYRVTNLATGAVIVPAGVVYDDVTNHSDLFFTSAFSATATWSVQVGFNPDLGTNTTAAALQLGTLFSTATPYSHNANLGNNINVNDADLYQFSVTAAGTVNINASPLVSTLNVKLRVFNSAGVGISASTSVGAGNPISLSASLPAAGTYYVGVSSVGNNTYNSVTGAGATGGTGSGPYSVTIGVTNVLAVSPTTDTTSFNLATQLGALGAAGQTVSNTITNGVTWATSFLVPQFPGTGDEPGHRNIPVGGENGGEGTLGPPSAPGTVVTRTYNFPNIYGSDPLTGQPLINQITPTQRDDARAIMALYSRYAGIQWVEVADTVGSSLAVVTGDIRAVAPTFPPNAVGGISGGGIVVMNANQNFGLSPYGSSWFGIAFHEIGHSIGLDHSYDFPSVMGQGISDQVYPGDLDLVQAIHANPPQGADINVYRFSLNQAGTLSAAALTQKLVGTPNLDSVLSLYQEDPVTHVRTLLARNDNYIGTDAFINLHLAAGTYFVGVSAAGNTEFDPNIPDSGFGGRSEGAYTLQLSFAADVSASVNITDVNGVAFYANQNGQNNAPSDIFWFNSGPTLYVDKDAPSNAAAALGTAQHPYTKISDALAAAAAGTIVRIEGNGGTDGNPGTLADDKAYLVGFDSNGIAQTDGTAIKVPANVTLVVDAGAIIKLRQAVLDVGTSALNSNRAGGALQVLGTPRRSAYFTSLANDALGGHSDPPNFAGARAGDWGGLVLRSDSDVGNGVFLNYINHAAISYGGGQVNEDSIQQVFDSIHIVDTRPTITFNTITNSADSAISADPNAFRADDGRIGPDIHNNQVTNNTINGIFLRIRQQSGQPLDTLQVAARLDATDLPYVLGQNLLITGAPAGQADPTTGARFLPGSLVIDPGVVFKATQSHIEATIGNSVLLAEGTATNPIILTSIADNRYGGGGTFQTGNNPASTPAAGDWGGLFFNAASTGSLDWVTLAYGGGATPLPGEIDNFNAIEIQEARVRIADTTFLNNAGGQSTTSDGRAGLLGNSSATIFVRGAQPIIVNNTFENNQGPVISINANALVATHESDWGRGTGTLNAFDQYLNNSGPLVRLNRFQGNDQNGMEVRGGQLTTGTVWDDTDIVHILRNQIVDENLHTYGGLRLQSDQYGSLVVKLQGATAGFLATGVTEDITDRIGGTIQVVGTPGHPVILTSLNDSDKNFKAGAGYDLQGNLMTATVPGNTAPVAGDWNGITLFPLSNDTNMRVHNEIEPPHGPNTNDTAFKAENLGTLATGPLQGSDESPIGFEVHGLIKAANDADVYSFTGTAGTRVWLDLGQASSSLQSMIELVDSQGNALAASFQDNAGVQQLLGSAAIAAQLGTTAPQFAVTPQTLLNANNTLGGHFYSISPHDPAGMSLVLPGLPGNTNTYYVRVRSVPAGTLAQILANPEGGTSAGGQTQGAYQVQIRLQQQYQHPGSTVQFADIRYATNAVHAVGLPDHSPLVGTTGFVGNGSNSKDGATDIGNVLSTDQASLSIAGNLGSPTTVQWYRIDLDYSQIQAIGGVNGGAKFWSTVFDVDYAGGLTRANTILTVYDPNGKLMYVSRGSNAPADQQPTTLPSNLAKLSEGSSSTSDPFIGPVEMPAGTSGNSGGGEGGSGVGSPPPPSSAFTYWVAVTSNAVLPYAMDQYFNAIATNYQIRLEPVDSIHRVLEDHIGEVGISKGTTNPQAGYNDGGGTAIKADGNAFGAVSNAINLSTHITPYKLGDVPLYVNQGLETINPADGSFTKFYGGLGSTTAITVRNDGKLYSQANNNTNGGILSQIDPGNGNLSNLSNANVPGFAGTKDANGNFTETLEHVNVSSARSIAFDGHATNNSYRLFFNYDDGAHNTSLATGGVPSTTPSRLYQADPNTGNIIQSGNSYFNGSARTGFIGYIVDPNNEPAWSNRRTMGMAFLNGTLYGVSNDGLFYSIATNNTTNVLSLGSQTESLPTAQASVINVAGLPTGLSFHGLTLGPQNVDLGAYKNDLFASTDNALYAFKLSGSNWSIDRVFQATAGANEVQSLTPVGTPTGGTYTITFKNASGVSATTVPLAFNAPVGVSVNEVFSINEQATVTAGNFTLTVNLPGFGPQTTGPIAFNANAFQVASALLALSGITPADIRLNGTLPGTMNLTFMGAYTGTAIPTSVQNVSLVGGTISGNISTVARLSVQQALDNLANVNVGDLIVSGTNLASGMSVEFAGQYAQATQPLLTVNAASLTGTTAVKVQRTTTGTTGSNDEQQTITASAAPTSGTFTVTVTNNEGVSATSAAIAYNAPPVTTTNEVYTLTENSVTGGFFSLQLTLPSGAVETTRSIPYNATAAQVLQALTALKNVTATDVTTSGGPLNTTPIQIRVRNVGIYRGELINIAVLPAGLQGAGTVTGAITTPPVKSVQQILDAMSIAQPGELQVTGTNLVTGLTVRYTGQYAGYAMPLLTVNSSLVGASLTVAETNQGGATTVTSFNGGAQMAFSPFDFNLWHPTINRAFDAGHGVNASADGGQTASTGFDSYAFNFDRQQNFLTYLGINGYGGQYGVLNSQTQGDLSTNATLYSNGSSVSASVNLPGRLHGDLLSNSFDLSAYASADQPTLYFNYYLGDSGVPRDPTGVPQHAHAYISKDNGVTWTVIASDNPNRSSAGSADQDLPAFASSLGNASTQTNQFVQQLFASSNVWRQARIDLSSFAGNSNLKLRFSFDTPSYSLVQNTNNEGFYVADLIVGMAGRGEMATGAVGSSAEQQMFSVPVDPDPMAPKLIQTGPYQLEIRRGYEYGTPASSTSNSPSLAITQSAQLIGTENASPQQSSSDGFESATLTNLPWQTFGPNAWTVTSTGALSGVYSAQAGSIANGQSSTLQTMQTTGAGEIRFLYSVSSDANASLRFYIDGVAQTFTTPVSGQVPGTYAAFAVTAGTHTFTWAYTRTGVFLSGANTARIDDVDFPLPSVLSFAGASDSRPGDSNVYRPQGHVEIVSNTIRDFSNIGVWAQSPRDAFTLAPNPGTVRNLPTLDNPALIPGLEIANNLIYDLPGSGTGIQYEGDTSAVSGPAAPIPYARIINNTIYGAGTRPGGSTGIKVINAGPTILNNIFANLETGLNIDNASAGNTVVGYSVFSNNGTDATANRVGNNVLTVTGTTPLFVDPSPAAQNFYLAEGSPAIDSALASLPDRPTLAATESDVGISQSAIFAPPTDRYGQLRVNDPNVPHNPGQGQSVFYDRGAIERSDFLGPRATLLVPLDGGTADLNPAQDSELLQNPGLVTQLVLQIADAGIGTDFTTVVQSAFTLQQVTAAGTVTLVPGVDYIWTDDPNQQTVTFTSVSQFLTPAKYIITIDTNAITDLAGNKLQGNQADGSAQYVVVFVGAQNDAPVNNVPPGLLSTLENQPLTFSAANNNAISVADGDAFLGTNQMTVTLTATHGTISLFQTTNLTLTTGTGTNDTTVTFTGDIAALNAALNGLVFTPTTNFFSGLVVGGPGPHAQITITTNDLGNFNVAPSPAQQATNTIDIFVVHVNSQPTLDPISPVSALENAGPTNVALTGIGPGPLETQNLTVSVVSSNPALFQSLFVSPATFTNATGTGGAATLTFQPKAFVSGTATVAVTVQDDGGTANGGIDTITRFFVITVTPVNQQPTLTKPVDQTYWSDAGPLQTDSNIQTVSLAGIGMGTGDSGQTLTVSAVSSNSAVVAIQGVTYVSPASTGTLSLNIGHVASGITDVVIGVTVQDNGGTANGGINSITRFLTVHVKQWNHPVIATNDTLPNSLEGQTRTIPFTTLTANDKAGAFADEQASQTLTIISVANPVGGSVQIVGSSVQFTPTFPYSGPASFTYTVRDNGQTQGVNDFRSATATASFTILHVNQQPTLNQPADQTYWADAGPNQTDPSVQSITLTGIGIGPNDPAQTLTVSALSANPAVVTVQGVTYTSPNATGTLKLNIGHVSSNTDVQVTVTVKDNGGTANGGMDTISHTFMVHVKQWNHPVTAVNDTLANSRENQTYNIPIATLLANDSAGPVEEPTTQTLTITALSSVVGGTAQIVGTNVVFTPTPFTFGPASFIYTVSDNGQTQGANDFRSDTASVNFNVLYVNQPPTLIQPADQTYWSDAGPNQTDSNIQTITLTGIGMGTADAGQTLTVSASSLAPSVVAVQGVTYMSPAGTATLTLKVGHVASGISVLPITVTVKDSGGTANGGSDTLQRVFFVSVKQWNHPATAANDVIADDFENTQYVIPASALTANDSPGPFEEATGQTLTIISVANAVGGTAQVVGGNVVFNPTPGTFGPAGFTYTVQDNGQTQGVNDFRSASANVTFNLLYRNQQPTLTPIADQTYWSDAGPNQFDSSTQIIPLTGIGPGAANESTQTVSVSAFSGNGAIVAVQSLLYSGGTTGTLVLTVGHVPSGIVDVPLVVVVKDTGGTANGAQDTLYWNFKVHVKQWNHLPIVVAQSLSPIFQGAPMFTIPANVLLQNDNGGPFEEATNQTLSITSAYNAVGGTVSFSNNAVTFNPDPAFSGTASFGYTVFDNGTTQGVADPRAVSATASFQVKFVNQPPVRTSGPIATPQILSDSTVPPATSLGLGALSYSPGPGTGDVGQSLTLVPTQLPPSSLGTVFLEDGLTPVVVGGTYSVSQFQRLVFIPALEAIGGPVPFNWRVQDNGGTANGGQDSLNDTMSVSVIINPNLPIVERMFRTYNPNAQQHFFTVSQAEYHQVVDRGYSDETVHQPGFNVMAYQYQNATPIHRLYNLQKGWHYFTLSDAERDYLVNLVPPSDPNYGKLGWVSEGESGFLYPSQQPGSIEVFMLYNNNSGEHFYTADANERNSLVNSAPGVWLSQTSLGFGFYAAADAPFLTHVTLPASGAAPASRAAMVAADLSAAPSVSSSPASGSSVGTFDLLRGAVGSVSVSAATSAPVASNTGTSSASRSPALALATSAVDPHLDDFWQGVSQSLRSGVSDPLRW